LKYVCIFRFHSPGPWSPLEKSAACNIAPSDQRGGGGGGGGGVGGGGGGAGAGAITGAGGSSSWGGNNNSSIISSSSPMQPGRREGGEQSSPASATRFLGDSLGPVPALYPDSHRISQRLRTATSPSPLELPTQGARQEERVEGEQGSGGSIYATTRSEHTLGYSERAQSSPLDAQLSASWSAMASPGLALSRHREESGREKGRQRRESSVPLPSPHTGLLSPSLNHPRHARITRTRRPPHDVEDDFLAFQREQHYSSDNRVEREGETRTRARPRAHTREGNRQAHLLHPTLSLVPMSASLDMRATNDTVLSLPLPLHHLKSPPHPTTTKPFSLPLSLLLTPPTHPPSFLSSAFLPSRARVFLASKRAPVCHKCVCVCA